MKNIPESTQKHIDDLVKTINKLNKERNKLNLENKELKKQLTIPNVSNCDSDTKDLIEHTKRVLDLIKSKSGMAVKVLSNRVNNKLEQLN